MSQFSGTFNSQRVQNHSFNTKDKLLVGLGFASFNIANCYDAFAKTMEALAVAFPQLARFGGNPPFARNRTFLDLDPGITIAYVPFNKSTRKYDTTFYVSLNRMYELIAYHETNQQGRANNSPTNNRQIKEIQNSLSGCIRIDFNLSAIVPGQSGTALIDLYFQSKARRSASRVMTGVGPPMYTGVGKTPAGTSYAGNATRAHQSSSSENMGSYIPPGEGGYKDFNNCITAPLKLHYNSTEKVFEAGNAQVLGKLLTPLAAADVNDTVPPSDGSVARNSDFYDPDGQYYNGSFTTALAMPLAIENGNPHMFGPNIIECQRKTFERVRVVNRSPKEYKAGTVVMLTNINGEWIASSLGEADTKPKSATIQDWSFSKMIVDSDSFFKDGRYYNNDDYENYSSNITPTKYETKARAQFYYVNDSYLQSLSVIGDIFGLSIRDIATFNFDTRKTVDIDEQQKDNPNYVGDDATSPIQYSNRYISTTVFDLMSINNGGFLDNGITKANGDPVLDKINAFSEGFDKFTGMDQVFPFWGPVFTDGYRSITSNIESIDRTKNGRESLYFNRDFANFSGFRDDPKNVPAEATSKIIDVPFINNIDLGTNKSNECRTPLIYPPGYFSSPVSTKHIQFIPLTDTLVGHTDGLTKIITKFGTNRKFYNQVYGPNGLLFGYGTGDQLDVNLHGKIKDRNSPIKIKSIKPSCFSTNYANLSTDQITAEAEKQKIQYGLPVIPYDCYIKRPPTKVALGAPNYFRDSDPYIGANCVGITAGMCTISKPGGGDINFEVKQNVGLVAQASSTTGNVGVTLDNFLLVLTGIAGTKGQQYEFPQWGSSDDAIDSFGTTALHIRIFDGWPDEDTLYDPRYFAVLHFNPIGTPNTEVGETKNDFYFGALARNSSSGLTNKEINDKYQNPDNLYLQIYGFPVPKSVGNNYITYDERPRRIDKVQSPVDIRVPTLDTAVTLSPRTLGSISSNDLGIVLKKGHTIDKNTGLRPENEWRVNPIRRGQLLTGNGFTYKYNVIGLDPNSGVIVKRGTGFQVNTQIDCGKGVVITVKTVEPGGDGGIGTWTFEKESNIPYLKNLNQAEISLGEGFLPSDFNSSETERRIIDPNSEDGDLIRVYRLEIPSPDKNGEPAIVEYTQGVVWEKLGYDAPPVEHVPLTRISVGSRKGQIGKTADLYAEQSVSLGLGGNNTGEYKLFTFFHNDITHTPATARTFAPGYLQYLDLNIV
jgi:hypothetical protein